MIGDGDRTSVPATPATGARPRARARFPIGGVVAGAAVVLAALVVGLYFSRSTLDSFDAWVMFVVTKSIVTTHTTYVPAQFSVGPGQVIDLSLASPHSTYGLGMSLLEVPLYLFAPRSGQDPRALFMLINPVIFALVALVVYLWARVAEIGTGGAVLVSLMVSFGTMLLPYTQTGFSEVGTALGVALVILGVELSRRRPSAGSLVAGAGVSIAVLMRPDSALLVAPVAAIALVVLRSWRALPLLVVASAPGVLTTAIYSLAGGLRYQGFTLREGFSHPFLTGLSGFLVSPGRGLVLYVPLVVLAVVGIPWAWRRSPVVTAVCLALMLDRLLFYAGWFTWYGGWSWGPRFLLPAMPALGPLLLPFVQGVLDRRLSWRRWAIAAVAVPVLAVSVGVQFLGAAVRYDTDTLGLTQTATAEALYRPPGTDTYHFDSSQPLLAALDGPIFDWRLFPIAEHARKVAKGRDLTGRPTPWSDFLEHHGVRL
jgi:hypothetical protein